MELIIREQKPEEKKIIFLDQHVISRLTRDDRGFKKYFNLLTNKSNIEWVIVRDNFYTEFGGSKDHAERQYYEVIQPIEDRLYFTNSYMMFLLNEVFNLCSSEMNLPIPESYQMPLITKCVKGEMLETIQMFPYVQNMFRNILINEHRYLSGIIEQIRNVKKDFKLPKDKNIKRIFEMNSQQIKESYDKTYEIIKGINKNVDKVTLKNEIDEYLKVFVDYPNDIYFINFVGFAVAFIKSSEITWDHHILKQLYQKYKNETIRCPYFTIFYTYLMNKGNTLTANDVRDIKTLCWFPYAHIIFMDNKNKKYFMRREILSKLSEIEQKMYEVLLCKIKSYEDLEKIEEYFTMGFAGIKIYPE